MTMMTQQYKEIEVVLEQDYDTGSPRTWYTLGTFVAFHKRENHGDTDHGYRSDDYESWDDLLSSLEKEHGPLIYHNVYMYSHSGSTVSTTPFSCTWDSGQLGIIFVSRKQVREEYGWPRITKTREEQILNYLDGEIRTYDQWLQGDVWSYNIEALDASCSEFYGAAAAMGEARDIIDGHLS